MSRSRSLLATRLGVPAARAWVPVALASVLAAPPAVLAAEPARSTLREFVRVVDRPWQRIGLTVTVTDRGGRAVRGLTRDDFRLLEDGRPVDPADFGVEGARSDRPLSVAVLLDLSQSMQGQVKKVREAAGALLRGLRPATPRSSWQAAWSRCRTAPICFPSSGKACGSATAKCSTR